MAGLISDVNILISGIFGKCHSCSGIVQVLDKVFVRGSHILNHSGY